MSYTKKCKACKGKGRVSTGEKSGIHLIHKDCKSCEGTGVQLYDQAEEQFDEYSEFTGDRIHTDEINYIDLDEE